MGTNNPTDRVLLSVIADGMNEGQTVEWIAELHDEEAPELDNANKLVQLLQGQFEDMAHRVEAEAQIKVLK